MTFDVKNIQKNLIGVENSSDDDYEKDSLNYGSN